MTTGVLLSGGMDSAVALHWARRNLGNVSSFAIDYHQRHAKRELVAAAAIAKAAGVTHRLLALLIPWPPMKGDVVPGRNLLMLSVVAAQLAIRGGGEPVTVVIGANQADESGFPDCRADFLAAAGEAIGLGLGVPVSVVAPFIAMTKADIVREARVLGPDAWEALRLSWSCYYAGDAPCGQCAACVKRADGFSDAREVDPWQE